KINIPISIDTYKAETARRAILAGAHMINDIWRATKDEEMAHVAAEYNVPIILMHNRTNKNYTSIIDDMKKDFLESIALVHKAGVVDDNIIIDPGIGFAKTAKDNLIVMNHLDSFTSL